MIHALVVKLVSLLWLLMFTTSVTIDVTTGSHNNENDVTVQLPLLSKEDESLPLLTQPQDRLCHVGLRHEYRTVDLLNLRRTSSSSSKNENILETVQEGTTESADTTTMEDIPVDDVQELYFTQLLDHYNGHENRTFPQRYFRSDRFMRPTKKTNSKRIIHHKKDLGRRGVENEIDSDDETAITLVFICVGGEGPSLDASVLRDSVHCTGDMMESAQRLYQTYPTTMSIVLIALEHRYYGKSYPTFDDRNGYPNTNLRTMMTPTIKESPVTNENLIYLSSRQATADLANFIHTMFHNSNHLVYLFGGSYPGMMAAFTRTKYPYLVRGAISNSAPVQAVLNFDTYQSHVGYNLQQIDMNCYNIVRMGHLAITKILQQNITTKIQSLAKQFNLCHSDTVLLRQENQNLFVGDGVMYFGAQENDPHCNNDDNDHPFCNMEEKCIALTTRYADEMNHNTNATIETAAIAALAYLAGLQQQLQQQSRRSDTFTSEDTVSDNNDCFVVDWDETLNYIADPILGQADGLRSWLYQTCTEFGFYQTCSDHKCPFGIGYHTLQQDLTICQYAFQIYNTVEAVQNTNEWTGGWDNIEQTSRIFSVTGTVDPWSEMAIQHTSPTFHHPHEDQDPMEYPTPYQVPGASHHFWTHPSRDTDDAAVVAARQTIYQTLHDWIMSDIEKHNNGATSVQR